MADSKKEVVSFDSANPAWRHRLWVRLDTPEGTRVFVLWRNCAKLAVVLALAGWLALAAGAWAFVKYRRGADNIRFVDLAFLPLRYDHYRQAMSVHYYRAGEKLLASGSWSSGILNLRQAVAKDPRNSAARLLLADCFVRAQRPDLALNLLLETLQAERENRAYVDAVFNLLSGPDDAARRVDIGRRLLPDAPDASDLHREVAQRIAEAELQLGHFDAARQLAQAWFPVGSLERALLLAKIDEATGYPDLAILSLQAVLDRQPDEEHTALLLIQVYLRAHQVGDARRVATLRALQHPDSPGAACDLIALLYESGETAAADREFADFLNRYRDDTRALLLVAAVGTRLGRTDVVRRAVARAPRDEQGRIPLPLVLTQMSAECEAGEFREALATAAGTDAYTPLAPAGEGSVVLLRCWAAYGAGRSADGERWLTQFLQLSYPAASRDGLRLAARLDAIRQADAARRVLQALLDRNADDRPALLALVRHDLAAQAWPAVSLRVPQLLALDPSPKDLLREVAVRGGDSLNLTPDLRQRLQNAAD